MGRVAWAQWALWLIWIWHSGAWFRSGGLWASHRTTPLVNFFGMVLSARPIKIVQRVHLLAPSASSSQKALLSQYRCEVIIFLSRAYILSFGSCVHLGALFGFVPAGSASNLAFSLILLIWVSVSSIDLFSSIGFGLVGLGGL